MPSNQSSLPMLLRLMAQLTPAAGRKRDRKRVVRHLFFFLPLPLKIALPPDCSGLRFQGNSVHSQLCDLVEEGLWGIWV